MIRGLRRARVATLEVVQNLVGEIYDAALDDDLWPAFLANLSDAIGGSSAVFFSEDMAQRYVGFIVASRIGTSVLETYSAHFAAKDVWVQGTFGVPAGTVLNSAALIPTEDLVKSEFYNDFLRHQDIFHVVSTVVENRRSRCAFASVYRPRRVGDFGPDEHRLLRILSPHLRRALQLRSRQLTVGTQAEGCLDALATLAQGVVLVDRSGAIVWANPIAENLFSAQDGLRARRRQLCAGTARETSELLRLIASAAQAASNPTAGAGGVMAVGRPSLRRPYQVSVTPLPRAATLAEIMPDIVKVPVAAVFITDPEATIAPPEQALQRLYGLTPAEARLAAAFAAGDTLQGYADTSKLSLNYVRWLLKQIEAKTDTRSQVELVRLLVGHAAPPAISQ